MRVLVNEDGIMVYGNFIHIKQSNQKLNQYLYINPLKFCKENIHK